MNLLKLNLIDVPQLVAPCTAETGCLPCVSSTRQRARNARQSLCHAFFSETHDNVFHSKVLCRALLIARTTKAICRASNTVHDKEKHPTTRPSVTAADDLCCASGLETHDKE
jgi:hypothetical protein